MMKLKKRFEALFLSMALILQITGCSNVNHSQSDQAQSGSSRTEAEQGDINENMATASDESKILIAYFSAGENSDVDVISSASVTTVNGEAKGRLRAVADMI